MAKVNVQATHNTGGAAVTTHPASRSEGQPGSTASEPPEEAAPENPKLDTDLGEKRMTATNLATRPELRGEDGEATRETEQTPKPGRRAHSKLGSLGAPAPSAP